MEVERYYAIGTIAVIIFILWRIKVLMDLGRSIINDTLKNKEGRWSRTSLTMFTAWVTVLISYFYSLYKNGFNTWAFGVLVSVALGSKIVNAYSNKIDPLIQPPETTPATQ